MTEKLIQRQIELETQCLSVGRLKYYERETRRKSSVTSKVDMAWLNKHVELLASYIELKIEQLSKLSPGQKKPNIHYQLLKDLDPMMLAYHTLKSLVGPGVRQEDTSFLTISVLISTLIVDDMNYHKLSDKDHAKYRTQQKVVEDNMRTKFSIKKVLQRAGVLPITWEKSIKIHVGTWLINAAIELFDHWEIAIISKGKFQKRVVRMSQKLLEWFADAHDYMSELNPLKLPMVHPPLDWTETRSGGYLTDVFNRSYVIRTFDKEYLNSLDSLEISAFYKAINAAQSTPFIINNAILDVALQCWEEDIQIGPPGKEILPTRLDLEIPSHPKDWPLPPKKMKVEHPEIYKKYARRAARTFDANSRMQSKRMAANTTLSIAQQFRDEDAFYFPHNADFRGRIYPLPVYLNPQGNDLAKGLLQFAEGKPLGEDGAYWLYVHAANCWGVDKVSNDERVAWTERKLEAILDSAMDPMGGASYWMEADKPFSALAVAIELLRYQVTGDETISHLPIPMDGSCNGLQNFSALLRDPAGAAATNLAPSDKPNDIYQDVADLVISEIHRDALMGNTTAIIWQGHITRSTVKQPVMTLPYGATLNGMRDQILDWMKKNYPDLFKGSETWEAAGYLALITHRSIHSVVFAAKVAMDYLKKVASVVSKSGLPLKWETPIGFPVLQSYQKFKSKRITVHVGGRRMMLSYQTEESALDRRRQGMGVAPNFIHSLDSSHLMLTILQCIDNDITDFAMVHDSYATHAGNTSVLHACIRDSFYDMYSPNVLRRFHEEIMQQLEEDCRKKLPSLPEMGSFDLELVKKSQYFFA